MIHLFAVKFARCFSNSEFKKATTAAATSLNKRFNEKTIAVHVRYNSWSISLQSSAKHQREMTKFCVVWKSKPRRLIFLIFISNQSMCPGFRFVIVLTVINKLNDSRVPRDS